MWLADIHHSCHIAYLHRFHFKPQLLRPLVVWCFRMVEVCVCRGFRFPTAIAVVLHSDARRVVLLLLQQCCYPCLLDSFITGPLVLPDFLDVYNMAYITVYSSRGLPLCRSSLAQTLRPPA